MHCSYIDGIGLGAATKAAVHSKLQCKKRKVSYMINNFQDLQKFGQTGMDGYMKMIGEWNKGWQAIAAEMTDYSKRAFEDGTATFEKLASAKSMEQALEIQTSYAKRTYEDYMHQMSKIGAMYQSFAKDAFKPVERSFQSSR